KKIIIEQVRTKDYNISYWKLYSYATKRDWFLMIFGLICAAIAGATGPMLTIVFGQLIDYFSLIQTKQISEHEFTNQVNHYTLFFVYLAVISFFTNYFFMACWTATGERITRKIREEYLRAVLRQNIAYFDKLSAGEVTTRITNDTHLIQNGISEKVSMAFSYFIQLIVAFIIGFTKNWKMTLAIFGLIPIILINGGIFNKFTVKYKTKILDYYSNAAVIAEESISTIRTAVAFSQQKNISKIYESKLENAKKAGIKASTLNGLFMGSTNFFIYSTYALAYWYGSTLIINGETTGGVVVIVFFSVLTGSYSISYMLPDLAVFNNAQGAGNKIFETISRISPINIESDEGDKLDKVEGRIQLKNISFAYPSRFEIMTLKNVSLDIEPGTTVALVGFSGSGKSTIVSLILRFYDTIEGEILFDGHNIKGLNLKWLRRQTSLVGQEPVLFNTTIEENIAHGLIGSIYENIDKDKKHKMIVQACIIANAHDFIMNLPDKYETNVGEKGFLLSGGQKQRIAIARAIVKDPKILLLDEATSALDTQSESIVQDALDKASKNRTTIVIAHRLSTIRNATKIVVMNNGEIVEIGTHDELIQNQEGTYSKLVSAQEIQFKKEKSESKVTFVDSSSIVPEDYLLSKVITNKFSKSAFSIREYNDIEKGGILDYKYTKWELIKKIGKINHPEWYLIFIGIIAAFICGTAYPLYSFVYGKVINAFAEPKDELRKDANFWSLMFLIVGIIIMVSSFVQGFCFGVSGENLVLRIRLMLFAAILRQDISFFDKENNNVGALTSTLSMNATEINGLAGATLGIIIQILTTIIIGIIVALIVGWKLTLVVMITIPVLMTSGYYKLAMMSGFKARTLKAYEKSAQIACEGIANIRTVAALTREEDLWKIYSDILDDPMKAGYRNAVFGSITYGLASSANFFAFAIAFWYGARLFVEGEYNLFRFFTVFMAVLHGSLSSGRIFVYAPDIMRAKASAESTLKLLESVPKIDAWSNNGEKIENVKGHIEFSNVFFHYPTRSNILVLRDFSLEIKPGQFAAFVGPSGCGKSTTIGLIERFYDVISGNIKIDGVDISALNVNNLRECISLVSQEPSLYDMTIKENILFGCRPNQNPTQEDIERVCKEANIHDFIITLPEGYDTPVGNKGTQLSGGQKQRIAIARALIRNPKILLLDEATSALDSESEKVVQAALDKATRGRTTLAIAHRLSTIQHADIIFVIKDGKVAEKGTHQELLVKEGIYYAMAQEQYLGK
ncbi:P-loop containing nucleoside triphosphate hydrolase protein, partial [Glomus cerebriforme]